MLEPSLNLGGGSEFIQMPGTSDPRSPLSQTVSTSPTFSDPLMPGGGQDGPDDPGAKNQSSEGTPTESRAPENSGSGRMDIFSPQTRQKVMGDFEREPLKRQAGLTFQAYEEPPEGLYDPLKYDTDQYQKTLKKATKQEKEQLQDIRERNKERTERAMFRTMWHLAGPEMLKLTSGANIDTGTERAMRLAQDARLRADELERQGRQEYQQTKQENTLRRAQLEEKEERVNQKRERQAARSEYEATQSTEEALLSGITSLYGQRSELEAAEQKAAAERASGRRDRFLDWFKEANDLSQNLTDNPQQAADLAQAYRNMYPNASEEQVKAMVGRRYLMARKGDKEEQSGFPSITKQLGTTTDSFREVFRDFDDSGWFDFTKETEYTRPDGTTGNRINDLEGIRTTWVEAANDTLNDVQSKISKYERAGKEAPRQLKALAADLSKRVDRVKDMPIKGADSAEAVWTEIKPIKQIVNAQVGQEEGRMEAEAQRGGMSVPGPARPYVDSYLRARGLRVSDSTEQTDSDDSSTEGGEKQSKPPQAARELRKLMQKDGLLPEAGSADSTEKTSSGQQTPPRSPSSSDQQLKQAVQQIKEYARSQGRDVATRTFTPAEVAQMSDEEAAQLRSRIDSGEVAVVMDRGQEDPAVAMDGETFDALRQGAEARQQYENTEAFGNVKDAAETVASEFDVSPSEARTRLRRFYDIDVQQGDTASISARPDGRYEVEVVSSNGKTRRVTVPTRSRAETVRDLLIPRATQ